MLVGGLRAGGNCVWRTKLAWIVLKVVHWGRNHYDNASLGWCGANSLMVLGFCFSLGFFTILCASEGSRSFMGGSDVVHCVRVSLTGTTVALSWACWSLVWGLVWTNTFTLWHLMWEWGPSKCLVMGPHPGNVARGI